MITEQQQQYVDAVLDGKSKGEAATAAGYSHPTSSFSIEKSSVVKQALAEARSELSSAAQITRADVLEGFMEAIELARLMADPNAMISGYKEIAKMMGFNAPEVKKVEVSMAEGRLRSKYEAMSDEELLKIATGESTETIEGECRVVN